jgi:hypothetical protein
MLLRHSRLVAAMALLLVSVATAANAVVLWNQSDWNLPGEGSLNLSSTSCNMISGNTKQHTACDVHFSSAVQISSITIYETDGNAAGASQAYLWIAPKTGALPTAASTDVNNAANIVPISAAYVTPDNVNYALAVTASGLNVSLPAGDYWVSLTPKHSLGFFPYSVHLVTASAVVGDPTPSINACTANSDWFEALAPTHYDYAIKIEGDLPVPTLPTTWGALKSIYR